MDEKEKITKLSKDHNVFPESIQKKLGRDRMVVYAVYLLNKDNIGATFQRICVVLHKLFPESFSLTEFPEYLDSRTIRNCLWHCTHKHWLIGSDKTKYDLSESGGKVSLEIERLDKRGANIDDLPIKFKKSKDLITKSMDDSYLIKEIKDSEAYKKFLGKKELLKLDIILSLGGDRYSSKDFLETQLKTALEKARSRNEEEVTSYLLWVERYWRKYFK